MFGQRTLLKWTVPGLAHFFTFWAFVILISVYIEAYGALFVPDFHIPLIGRWPVLGFLQDFIASRRAGLDRGVLGDPAAATTRSGEARASRFYGCHTGGAWLILFMIFNVLWTMFLFRGASAALGTFPYESGAFVSTRRRAAAVRHRPGPLYVLESVGLLLHIGVMLAFTVIIAYRKHLHIFLAPINVSAKRFPKALGPLPAMEYERQADRLRGPARGRRRSAAARSRTSPGRACSTSRPAPSAAAARASARPGTPASRCPRSS